MRHVRLVLIGLLVSVLSASAVADDTPLEAKYLANEVVAVGKDTEGQHYFVLRMAFSITGPGNRWCALDTEFRLEQAIPLVKSDGQLLLKRWNNLFTPVSPRPAKWTDCRLDVNFAELQAAGNLPRGKTFLVWAMGVVLDYNTRKHVGSGWPVRAPLLVTTDAEGNITDLQAPPLSPPQLFDLPDKPVKLPVKPAQPLFAHLKLKSAATAYRTYTLKDKQPVTFFTRGQQQVWNPRSLGAMLEPVDSPDKALELAKLQFNGGILLKTREQLEAIEKQLRTLGWKQGEDLVIGPASFGGVVSPVEPLGYRVQLLVVEPSVGEELGDIAHHELTVSKDGWVGDKRTLCVRAPLSEAGRPEGWKQPAPANPAAYAQAVRNALTQDGSAVLGPFFKVQPKPVRVGLPRSKPFKNFLLPKNWPTAKPDKPKPEPKAKPDKKTPPKKPQKPQPTSKPTNNQPGPSTQPAPAKPDDKK